ncbi:pao retrotransposon peptidase domain-containing protein [Phthorimaea operculella]|nr:pao retrotransposon peptidase domain-containing protein [Phthorimaea operculella]
MPLRKWKSNEPSLVSSDISGHSSFDLNIGASEPCKTLGLGWQPHTDELHFSNTVEVPDEFTKRTVLSVISKIFDPLGLLSPCVIVFKMLLQDLWLHKLSWDERVPSTIRPEFLKGDESGYPPNLGGSDNLPELRADTEVILLNTHSHSANLIDFSRFSNLTRLTRAVAYVLRFIRNCKSRIRDSSSLSADELNKASIVIKKQAQSESFPEYDILLKNGKLPCKSPLLKLNPIMDSDGLMRLNGRLGNSFEQLIFRPVPAKVFDASCHRCDALATLVCAFVNTFSYILYGNVAMSNVKRHALRPMSYPCPLCGVWGLRLAESTMERSLVERLRY